MYVRIFTAAHDRTDLSAYIRSVARKRKCKQRRTIELYNLRWLIRVDVAVNWRIASITFYISENVINRRRQQIKGLSLVENVTEFHHHLKFEIDEIERVDDFLIVHPFWQCTVSEIYKVFI